MGSVSVVHWLVLVLPVAAVVGVILLFARRKDRDLIAPPSATRAAVADEPLPAVPGELETRLWMLLRDGQKIEAIKMVREELRRTQAELSDENFAGLVAAVVDADH